jgi:hypothetical protein
MTKEIVVKLLAYISAVQDATGVYGDHLAIIRASLIQEITEEYGEFNEAEIIYGEDEED